MEKTFTLGEKSLLYTSLKTQNGLKLSLDSIFINNFWRNIKSSILRIYSKPTESIPDRIWQDLSVCILYWYKVQTAVCTLYHVQVKKSLGCVSNVYAASALLRRCCIVVHVYLFQKHFSLHQLTYSQVPNKRVYSLNYLMLSS